MALFDFARDYMAKREQDKAGGRAATNLKHYTGNAEDYIKQYYGEAVTGYQPWIDTGKKAENVISDLMGLNGADAQAKAYENYKADPSYRTMVDTANQALTRSALSGSNIFSGNFATAVTKLNQDMATQGYGNYYNRLSGLSQQGLSATGDVARLKAGEGSTLASAELGLGSGLAELDIQKGKSAAHMYENWKTDAANVYNNIMQWVGLGSGMKGGKGGSGGGGGSSDYKTGSSVYGNSGSSWSDSEFSNLYSGM